MFAAVVLMALTQTAMIELWADPTEPLRLNQQVRVHFRSQYNAYVTVFRIDTDGRVAVLFPGTPWRNNWVRADAVNEVRPGPERYSFLVDEYPGQGFLFAVASPTSFSYTDYIDGEEWIDGSFARDGRIEGDPYEALTELIDAILPDPSAEFDYDVLPYDVGERHDYPRFLCYDCHAHAAYPVWNPYEDTCARVRVVISDDPYYYPARVTRSMRVVFTSPRRLTPRFLVEYRNSRDAYITKTNRRPATDRDPRRPANR